MKITTKNGTEISIGNPETSAPEHLRRGADRVRTVATALGGVAAVANLNKRGARVSSPLNRLAAKTGAVAAALEGAAQAASAFSSLRTPLDSAPSAELGDTSEVDAEDGSFRDASASSESEPGNISLDELRNRLRQP